MKKLTIRISLIAAMLLSTARAVASPGVDAMTDSEVSEYAQRMCEVMDNIENGQLCVKEDTACIRDEFFRQGLSYDDKASVQKRLVIQVGSIY